MHEASLRLKGLADMDTAFLPETAEKIARSQVSVKKEGDALVIRIKAEDTGALRATLSSYLRYVSAAMSAKKAMEE